MAAFEYQAVTANGRKKKGVLEADTIRQVRQQLREKGWLPLSVTPASAQEKQSAQRRGFSFKRKVKAKDLALITRQLSTLVASALPIEQALMVTVIVKIRL